MNAWDTAIDYWHLAATALGAAAAIATGKKRGWLRPRQWSDGLRAWISRRWNLETENQQLQLEVIRSRDQYRLERLKNSTHAEIETVLRERISFLESLATLPRGEPLKPPPPWDGETERRNGSDRRQLNGSSKTPASEPASMP